MSKSDKRSRTNTISIAAPLHTQKERLNAALFTHLLGISSIPLIGSGLGALLVGLSLWNGVDHWILGGWLALVSCVIVVRILLTHRCRKRLADHGYRNSEAIFYAYTTGLSGLAWGVIGLFVGHVGLIGQVIVITAVQAMVMGGVLTLGAFLPSFLSFALPAILPMVMALALIGDTPHAVLSLYCLIFLLLMIGIARRFNQSLRKTWQLTFDNQDLLGALTEANDRLAILADTDGLTGLANRRRFDEVLVKEFIRLRRSGAPFSLVMLDVDNFKPFNDTYGHVVGDECLKQVASVFCSSLNRAPDFAARYGGEEFVGILPETDHEGAVILAEKIREQVQALGIPHVTSQVQPNVTASLGVITLDCSTIDSAFDALTLVDKQLYRAKAQGRNRVMSWNGMAAGEALSI